MAKPGPPRNPRGLLKPRLQVKCTEAYEAWARELAVSEGIAFSELVHTALAAHAKRAGFRQPPPRT